MCFAALDVVVGGRVDDEGRAMVGEHRGDRAGPFHVDHGMVDADGVQALERREQIAAELARRSDDDDSPQQLAQAITRIAPDRCSRA